jgi:hypothetical protein
MKNCYNFPGFPVDNATILSQIKHFPKGVKICYKDITYLSITTPLQPHVKNT